MGKRLLITREYCTCAVKYQLIRMNNAAPNGNFNDNTYKNYPCNQKR